MEIFSSLSKPQQMNLNTEKGSSVQNLIFRGVVFAQSHSCIQFILLYCSINRDNNHYTQRKNDVK
jgi:hypothetical protein